MALKDDHCLGSHRRLWTSRFSVACGIFLVLGACLLIRYFGGSESAQAQAPSRRVAQRPTGNRRVPTTTSRTPRTTPSGANTARPSPSQTPSATENNVVAIVNGEQIGRDVLARECLRRHGKEVLQNVVNRHLILEACRQKGIQITSVDIDKEIVRLAGKLGLTPDRLLQVLGNERDITPQQYRNDIVWPMLALRRLAADQLTVTKTELDEAFESEYGPRVQVRMISASSREKAERVRAEAAADPSKFGTLAKNESEDVNSAAARGVIPPVRKHVGDATIEKVVFALEEGAISPVVEAAGQYLVFRCEKHLPEARVTAEQRKAINEQLVERIRERKLATAATGLFQQLETNAKVVNVYNNPELRQSMPGVAATINGGRITIGYLAEQCLARHGKEVLDGEINRTLLQQALRRRGLAVAEAELDQEIDRAAETYGYLKADGTVDREAWLKHITTDEDVTVDLYVRDAVWPSVALKKLVKDQVHITDDDIRKAFTASYGERVRVLAIVLGNRHTANEVWQMAKNNPTEQFFGELAHEYSIEPVSRSNYGEVPPIGQFSGQPSLEEEAFALGVGNELSGILCVGDKFIILRYQGRTEPVVTELEAVRDELVKDIREKKLRIAMTKMFDQLRTRAQIDNLLAGTVQSGQRGPVKPASHQTPARRAASGPQPAPRPRTARRPN